MGSGAFLAQFSEKNAENRLNSVTLIGKVAAMLL